MPRARPEWSEEQHVSAAKRLTVMLDDVCKMHDNVLKSFRIDAVVSQRIIRGLRVMRGFQIALDAAWARRWPERPSPYFRRED